MRYEQQQKLQLNKTNDATPDEVKLWREQDVLSRGDFDVMFYFVVVPSLTQFGTVAVIALIMFIIGVNT